MMTMKMTFFFDKKKMEMKTNKILLEFKFYFLLGHFPSKIFLKSLLGHFPF